MATFHHSRRAVIGLGLSCLVLAPDSVRGQGFGSANGLPVVPGGHRPSRSWTQLRFDGLVRQERDFSCGPAALATILTYYYRRPTTEATILEITGAKDETTFAQLAAASQSLGFSATGAEVTLQLLRTLQVPVIAFLTYRGTGHFTVIRGISDMGRVQLADPSWGNRTLQPARFARLFDPKNEGRGRILIIQSPEASRDVAWFTRPSPLEVRRADVLRVPVTP